MSSGGDDPVVLTPDSDATPLDRAVFEFPGVPLYVFGGDRMGAGRDGPDLPLDRKPEGRYRTENRRVSSHHLVIWRDGEQFAVSDLGSTNGTIVDGSTLEADEVCPLPKGAKLLVAGVLELKARTLRPPSSRPPSNTDADAPALLIEHPDFLVALVPGRFAIRDIVQNATPDAEIFFADGGLWLRGLSESPDQCRAVADGTETPWRATVRAL